MYKTKEEIAREVVAEVAASWVDTPDAFTSEEGGAHVFTFTVHHLSGATTIRYNPLPAAVQVVEKLSAPFSDSDETEAIVGTHARSTVTALLRMAPEYFAQALDELREQAETAVRCGAMAQFGNEKARAVLVENMIASVAERRHRYFDAPGGKGKRAAWRITGFHASYAIKVSLRERGTAPSEREAARIIFNDFPTRWKNERGAKEALRVWWQKAGYDRWEAVCESVRRDLQERESGRDKEPL